MAEAWDEEQLIADGFERVYVELEWYDGPRAGLADVNGKPHYFRGLDYDHADEADEYAEQAVVYARVSSADQKPDLDRQFARVTVWATGQRLAVDRVVTEVGSAFNGHREKFLSLLRDRPFRRSWSSTGTGSPGSEPSTSRLRCPRRAAGCWSSTRPRSTTTSCVT